MDRPGERLWLASERLRSALEEAVGLTRIRIELQRPDGPRRIDFVDAAHVLSDDPRHAHLRLEPPASITVPLRDGELVLGSVTIEDARRTWYPPEALGEMLRITGEYAPAFREGRPAAA